MVQSQLVQYVSCWVAHILWRLSSDDCWFSSEENNLDSYPYTVSKGLLCTGVRCVRIGVINTRKGIHPNRVFLDVTSVSGIRRQQLITLRYCVKGSHRRTVGLLGPACGWV
eukprot:1957288-Pyramimonas_sp.AAC.1